MASMKRAARKAPLSASGKEDSSTTRVLELSVTVGYLAGDVKREDLALLEKLMQDHTDAGLVSMERGDLEQHLHFQMVCRARVSTTRAFGILVRKYMNWHGRKNMSPTGKVMCKVLTNRLIHTWKGMVGYCLKDSGATRFDVAMHNITDEEVIAGKTLHSIYGKADLKQRVCLTTKNVGERAYVWFKYKETRQLTATMLTTLTDMVNSALFIPAAMWIIPFTGQGMDQLKMNAYWKCLTDPSHVVKSDIAEIFVNTKEYYKARYYPEEDDVVEPQLLVPKQENLEYCYDGTPSLQRTIPRTLGLDLDASGDDRCNHSGYQVPARTIVPGVGRKLHFEPADDGTPCKSMKMDAKWALDYIPLKDRALLPTNTFLPTVDALAAGPSKKAMSDAQFWEWLASQKAAASVASSGKLPIDTLPAVPCAGDAEEVEDGAAVDEMNVAAEKNDLNSTGLLHEGIELIILSSDSEGEDDEPSVTHIVRPAQVFEDRLGEPAITPMNIPLYSRADDDVTVRISAGVAYRYKEDSRN